MVSQTESYEDVFTCAAAVAVPAVSEVDDVVQIGRQGRGGHGTSVPVSPVRQQLWWTVVILGIPWMTTAVLLFKEFCLRRIFTVEVLRMAAARGW